MRSARGRSARCDSATARGSTRDDPGDARRRAVARPRRAGRSVPPRFRRAAGRDDPVSAGPVDGGCRGHGSFRTGARTAQGATRDSGRDRRRARSRRGSRPGRAGAQRLRQHLPGPRPVRPRGSRSGAPAHGSRPRHPQGHRRAHRDQPQQGGSRRAPAQRRARRHPGATAAPSRCPGGGPELHRRHGRAGGGRRGRFRATGTVAAGGGRRPGRPAPLRLLLLGPLCARHRVVRGRPGAARVQVPRPPRPGSGHRSNGPARPARRRPHRPLPSGHDGPDEHRVRPADLGGRHPASPFLVPGVRRAKGGRGDTARDHGCSGRLLGNAARRRFPAGRGPGSR